MKVDLHLHSKYSWDSKVPIEKYIELAESNDFGAIAITDHNSTDSHDIIKALQSRTSVILVPGQEINTLDGHLLVYGWLPTIDRDLSMRATVLRVNELADEINTPVRIIAAHPFDKLRGGTGKKAISSGVHGIETLNASCLFGIFNSFAKNNAKRTGLIGVGNSDSHRTDEFGKAYTEIPDSTSISEVLQNLDQGRPNGHRIGLTAKTVRFTRRKFGRMTE